MAPRANIEQPNDEEHYQLFEDLLLDISAQFINLPVSAIDGAIEDAQRRICKCLDVDLSALWQWSDKDRSVLTITHLHSPPNGPDRPIGIDASKTFPWLLERVMGGESMAFSTEELPEEAHIDKESRNFFGVKSSVCIPLKTADQQPLGIISFDTIEKDRCWSDRVVKRLQLVAEIFINSLARKRSEQIRVETEARLSLAAESAEAGLWELNYSSNIFWSTEQARKVFGYGSGEIITMERFERTVCAEDREEVLRALEDSFSTGNKIKIEYRIQSGEPGPKWICSIGRPYYNQDNSPSRMLGVSVDVTERKQLEADLRRNLIEVDQLRKQLEQENYYLREDLRLEKGFTDVIGKSSRFQSVLTAARQVSPTSATVLLLGETGTGKGVAANMIHQMSDRCDKSFVTVNCAALPSNLIESELFGREKGAFTGAYNKQIGRFEVANNGTIFLDEIGEMPLEMQAKLLRVLQENEFERLGSSVTVRVDVRVIAATGRDLMKDVQEGRFREDLFYRINVFPINIPSLKERKEDIPLLAQHFIEKYSRKIGKRIDRIPRTSLDKMMRYSWPGNIRELEHLVERSLITSPSDAFVLNEQFLSDMFENSVTRPTKDLESMIRDHISEVLKLTGWKIEGPGGAAEALNIHPSTLRFKLKKLKISRPS